MLREKKKFKYEGWTFSPFHGAMPPGFKGWEAVPVVREGVNFTDIDWIPEWEPETYDREK